MSTFMKPETEYDSFYVGETTEGTVILHPDVFRTEQGHYRLMQGERWRKKRGWYARLSAPGYLDCTDWSGPYATAKEAGDALSDLYDGDPIDDGIE